jgi:hypothetical protein
VASSQWGDDVSSNILADFTKDWTSNYWFCNVCTPDDAPIAHMSVEEAMRHELTPDHFRTVEDRKPLRPAVADPPDFEEDGGEGEGAGPSLLTPQALRAHEGRRQLDHVQDVVPWWVGAIEAAERGEEWKMADLLESIPDDDVWAMADGQDLWLGDWAGAGGDARNVDDLPGWDQECKPWPSESTLWRRMNPQRGWGTSGSVSTLRSVPRTVTASSVLENRKRRSRILKKIERTTAFHDCVQPRIGLYGLVELVATQEAADEERKRRMHQFVEVRGIYHPPHIPLLI